MRKLSVWLFGLCVMASAQADLLINGSFEDPDVAYGDFDYIDASLVPGWEGDTLEVWDHLYTSDRMRPYDGEQYIETNSKDGGDGVYEIYQSFSTTVGEWYQVSMMAQARRSNDEVFWYSVEGADALLVNQQVTEHNVYGWQKIFYQFQADSTESTLYITSYADVDPSLVTAANLIDDVKVVNMSQHNIATVPTPLLPAALGFGLIAFGLIRNNKRNCNA